MELPFVIGVMANLSGHARSASPLLWDRVFERIDRDSFDGVLAHLAPTLSLEVEDVFRGSGHRRMIALGFRSIDDFHPERLVERIDAFRPYLDERKRLSARLSDEDGKEILDERTRIDLLLSRQLSAILHHPEFQRLEAAWRGLHYLVSQSETSQVLRIKVLDIGKEELRTHTVGWPDLKRSALYSKLCPEPLSERVPEPFGALVGDYEFGRGDAVVAELEQIAKLAEAANVPFLAAASPKMFGCNSFAELRASGDLDALFARPSYRRWRSFRESAASRYLVLCLPRILLRESYVGSPQVNSFSFMGIHKASESGMRLWGNPAYALAVRLANSFARTGSFAFIRGVEGGGLVDDLPVAEVHSAAVGVIERAPIEVSIDERRATELAHLGFTPLVVDARSSPHAVFRGPCPVWSPPADASDTADARIRRSIQLPHIMIASRFAHCIRAISRDVVGSFDNREHILNDWISQYVAPPGAGEEEKVRRPLDSARVEVGEIPGQPGMSQADVILRPHYSLEDLDTSLRLVVDLPSPGFRPPAGEDSTRPRQHEPSEEQKAPDEPAPAPETGDEEGFREDGSDDFDQYIERADAAARPPRVQIDPGDDLPDLLAEVIKATKMGADDHGLKPLTVERALLQLRERHQQSSIEGGSIREPATLGDPVDCTVFAPPEASPGAALLVQVFAHIPEQASQVEALARQFDEESQRRAFKSLETQVVRGSRLWFHLVMPGLVIDDPIQVMTWTGRPESVQFGVGVPRAQRPGNVIGTVTVSLDSIPIGHIKFKLRVIETSRTPSTDAEPTGADAHRYQLAFISYASADRPKVLMRVQMLAAVGIRYFQDLLDLDPGDRWERELYRHVDECDLFLLFWSSFAKQSEWVLKEVKYALSRKADGEFLPPEIRPVIIEGPPIVPPPDELSHLHFNDRLLYFMTQEKP
jgi:type VI secretion system protein ImpC